MNSGDINAVYLGFHREPQDIWREASASRACYRGHVLWVGLNVSSGCLASDEQCEGIWGRILFWLLSMCFLF